jgi:thioredoxin reductase (NADPH)
MTVDKDLIIIGGGAAGLSAAQYAARSNLDVLLFEEMAAGGQLLIIDAMENYPGFPEPIQGLDFSELMEKQARQFGAEIILTTVKNLEHENGYFTVETGKGSFTTYAVILATGAQHKHLDIPGEKEFAGRGISYCATCDGPFFRGKKILVVGGGDAACDEASFLANLSEHVVLIHRRDRFRAQKVLAERVLNNPHIEVRFNTVAKEIRGKDKVEKVLLEKTGSGENYEEDMEGVFIFIGSIPQTQLVPELPKDEGGYIITNQRMETEVPGLYAAGDLRNTPFRQVVVSAADGAIAAYCASQYIDDMRGEAYK